VFVIEGAEHHCEHRSSSHWIAALLALVHAVVAIGIPIVTQVWHVGSHCDAVGRRARVRAFVG
jgi:hypothetical protein